MAKTAAGSFPRLMPDASELGLDVYHLGYHSAESYGATPYLINDKESGINILIDTPRYNSKLITTIKERFGGVDYIYLTHVDDIAEHVKFADAFGAKRVIHESEAHAELAMTSYSGAGIEECEIKLEGQGPWEVFPGVSAKVYYQPGHTIGHTVLVYKDTVAFTGDHLAKVRQTGNLDAFTAYCKFSLEEQANSLDILNEEVGRTVKLVLPGHGRAYRTDFLYDDLHEAVQRMRADLDEARVPYILQNLCGGRFR
ncbi:hypothetical protein CYMTET_55452 [Cymbomonas tetramitiformis]|uniref:Metallo-beta-lactamase domain-containing protein n=1 Tax=Cymbomonas tetramitiformis TaxID=36881 RepID=A0AAE0EMZ0_9CHLO|nr:hypothetical protein CYMTET_55452 [Cymbomonas tetramitiformis]